MDKMSMSSSDSSTTTMSTMSMIFSNSKDTPLFSSAWTPTTTGAYAGTCIFLIILSVISRALFVYRHKIEQRWLDRAINRRYVVVQGQDGLPERLSEKDKASSESAVLTVRGVDETVRVVKTHARSTEGMPFRLSTDVPRAVIFTIQAGIGYLLMLAVMTMNVGYFMSVLMGLFLGELVLGRYAVSTYDGHH